MNEFIEYGPRAAADAMKAVLGAVQRRGPRPGEDEPDSDDGPGDVAEMDRGLTGEDCDRQDELFRAFSPMLARYAMRVSGGPPAVAEDLVQEAFQLAVRRWYVSRGRDENPIVPLRERSDEQLRAWLIIVIRNKCADRFRRREVLAASPMEMSGPEIPREQIDPADSVAGADLFVRLLKSLPPQRRRVAWLSWHEGLSRREIAEEMGLAESTVGNHLAAVRNQLAPVIRAEAESPEGGERR